MSDAQSLVAADAALPVAAGAPAGGAGAWFTRIPMALKIRAGLGLVALVAVLASTLMWLQQPDWRVLYTNVSDRDGGAVIAALTQLNVPYRYSDGTGAIQVPASHLHDVRLKLASQGLPKNPTAGFELLENQKFGTTQFQERMNYQRGLEGELARSIQSLGAVESARVHLALPNQVGFLRDMQKPSASIVLTLRGSRQLDRQQVAGIVHLVASSVPDLDPRQVSVVDQNGTLVSDIESTQGLDATQLGHLRNVESQLSARVVALLEPIVGRGNVRAQVAADLDFTQQESTAEQYRPNQAKDQAAIRSQQSHEASERGAGSGPQGIPGALSNQPPPSGQAPVNGQAQPTRAAGAGGGPGAATAAETSSNRDLTTNYELDKTVRVTRQPVGAIKRLSVAILLNQRTVTGADGKPVTTPLSDKEIESVNALARDAVGFSQQRGDSINVVNAAFTREPGDAGPDGETAVVWWKDPANVALAREGLRQLGIIVVALLIITTMIRPALRAANPPKPKAGKGRKGDAANDTQAARSGRHVDARVDETLSLPGDGAAPAGGIAALGAPQQTPDGGAGDASVGQQTPNLVELARSNPTAVANIVRTWINPGGADAA